jgi:uncharacterized membrane protein YfcA
MQGDRRVNIWYAVIIAITFLTGGHFGSKISLNLVEQWIKRIFIAGMLKNVKM